MATVTIIIPTFNRENIIQRTLNSLVRQTYIDFEVIVVDDGSTDKTKEVVDEYLAILKIRYFWIENFGGPSKARNLGIKMSKGRYIAFLDSDDWWHRDKLMYSVKYLEEGHDLVYHNMYISKTEDQLFNIKKTKSVQVSSPVFEYLCENGNMIVNSSVVVRKNILNKIGSIDESKELIFWEDFDYWLRAARVTNSFKMINKTLGYYGIDTGNSSSNEKNIKNIESFSKKYLINSSIPWWVRYRKAIAFYKMNDFERSRDELSKIQPPTIRYRIIIIIIYILIFYKSA